jgi:rhodanese-related sulfurtransferase
MLGKRMPSSPANAERLADAEESIVKQLPPLEFRDLIKRLSGPQYGETSSDRRCLVILDVRTLQEYRSGHLNGSINLDFRSASFADELEVLDRDNAYLVYCRTGVRSGRAATLMKSLGFREIYDLAGGIAGWKREGFEIVSDVEN